MTRKKVKLALITNEAARKATFKKRKKGFVKKLNELTTLCGIQACAIIFSPFNSNPDIWPSPLGAHKVLSHFKTLPQMDQYKKMVNQETFIRHRISKAASQLKKLQRDNRDKEIAHLMFRSLLPAPPARPAPPPDLNVLDLNDLAWMVDQKLADISNRIHTLLINNNDDDDAVPKPPTNQQPPAISVQPAWFVDMAVCTQQPEGFNVIGDEDDDVMMNIQFPNFIGDGEDIINIDHQYNNLAAAFWSN